MFKKLKNALIKTAEHFEDKRVEKANKKFEQEYYEIDEEYEKQPSPKDGTAVHRSPWIKPEEEKGQFDEVEIKGGVARRLPKSHDENKKHIDELKNEVEKEEIKPRSLGLRRKLPTKAGTINEQDQYYDLLKTDPKAAMELPYYKRCCAEIDQERRGEKNEKSIRDVVQMHEEIESEKQDERILKRRKELKARREAAQEKDNDQDLER